MEKLNLDDLEQEKQAPDYIKRNVAANLDFYRLMGDTTHLYVQDFFEVFIELLGIFGDESNQLKDPNTMD